MANPLKNQDQKNKQGQSFENSGRVTGSPLYSKFSSESRSQNEDASDRKRNGRQDNYGEQNQNEDASDQGRSSFRGHSEMNDENEYGSSTRTNKYGSQGGNWPTIPHAQTFSGDYGNDSGIHGNQMGYGFSRQGGYVPDREDIASRSDMQVSWGGDQRNYDRGMRVRSQGRNDQYGYEQSRGKSMRTQSGDYGSEGRYGNSNYENMNDYDNYGSRREQDFTHGSFRTHRNDDYRQNDSQGGASNREGVSGYGNENYNRSRRGGWGNGSQGGNWEPQSGNRSGNYDRAQGEYGSQRAGNYGGQYDEQRGARNESYGNRSEGEYGWQRDENYEGQPGAQGSAVNDTYGSRSHGGYGSQGGQGGYSRGRSNQGGYGHQGNWQSRGGSYNEEMGSRRGSQRDSSYGGFDEDEYGSPNARRRRNENDVY